jgi:hypothetical protein
MFHFYSSIFFCKKLFHKLEVGDFLRLVDFFIWWNFLYFLFLDTTLFLGTPSKIYFFVHVFNNVHPHSSTFINYFQHEISHFIYINPHVFSPSMSSSMFVHIMLIGHPLNQQCSLSFIHILVPMFIIQLIQLIQSTFIHIWSMHSFVLIQIYFHTYFQRKTSMFINNLL